MGKVHTLFSNSEATIGSMAAFPPKKGRVTSVLPGCETLSDWALLFLPIFSQNGGFLSFDWNCRQTMRKVKPVRWISRYQGNYAFNLLSSLRLLSFSASKKKIFWRRKQDKITCFIVSAMSRVAATTVRRRHRAWLSVLLFSLETLTRAYQDYLPWHWDKRSRAPSNPALWLPWREVGINRQGMDGYYPQLAAMISPAPESLHGKLLPNTLRLDVGVEDRSTHF